jgi:membrane protein
MDTSQTDKNRSQTTLTTWADTKIPNPSLLNTTIHRLLRIILITLEGFKNNDLSLRSSALTYTVLLSLVPMLAMSTAVVKGLGGGDQLREAAYTYIESLEHAAPEKQTAPSEEKLTDHLRSAVDKLFDYVDRTNFATLGTIGMIGILLSVILVLSHIESAMNAIWKVQNGRSIVRKIADYLTLLVLMPISINVAFAASAFLANPKLASKVDVIIPFLWLQTLLLQLLPVFFIALTLYVIYIFFPNTKVKTLPAAFGAILAAFLWFSIQNIYISLQVGVAKYNAIYGSFATLPLFLIWMYFGWIFILAGAQVAFAVQNQTTYRLRKIAAKPSQNLAAAFDIITLTYSSFDQKSELTVLNLYPQLPEYPEAVLEEVLAQLQDAGIIHLSQSNRQLLPSEPMKSFNSQTVVDTILGSDAPDTPGGNQSLQTIKRAGTNHT